jgi:hypothetical protein
MRFSLAGGAIVVLAVFAIVMLQPGARASATAFAPGSIPLERSPKMGLGC